MAEPSKPSPILLSDLPLRPRADEDTDSNGAVGPDKFRLADRMSRLVDAILAPETGTPFTVAITGDWGTGKTSAMGFLDEHLRHRASASDSQTQVTTCWLKPWKYQDREQVIRGFLFEVIAATKPDARTLKKVVGALGGVAGGMLSLVTAKGIDKDKAEVGTQGKLTGAVEEGKAIYDAINNPEARFSNAFESGFKKIVESKFDAKHRLVVFIDDLDRCLPAVALQVLEAIKLYLDVPNIVFVVGVDRTVIDNIVVSHYCEALKPSDTERSGIVAKARRYLDKMFQVEFQAPPPEREIRKFIQQQLDNMEIWQQLEQGHKEAFEIAIQEMGQINPRAIVRAINTAIIGTGDTQQALKDHSGSDEERAKLKLRLAQSIQRQLVLTVTSRLDDGDYCPDVQNIVLRDDGVKFFVAWSRACVANPGKPRYFAAETDRVQHEVTGLEVPTDARGRETPKEGPDTSHLESVVSQWPKYKKLMSHPAIGVCMGLPWDDEGEGAAAPVVEPDATGPDLAAAFQLLVEAVARQRRTVPSEIDQDELRKATQLDLSDDDQVNDAVLGGVAQLTGLTELYLFDTQVTDTGMKSLEGLTELTGLHLGGTQVTDAGLKSLERLTGLTGLYLGRTQVTDAGMRSLEGLTGLTALYLYKTKVTDAGLKSLEGLTRLTTLDLIRTQVTDAGLKSLERLTGLMSLELGGTQVTDAGQARLQKALPKCVIFR